MNDFGTRFTIPLGTLNSAREMKKNLERAL